jgi:hypothetical protein
VELADRAGITSLCVGAIERRSVSAKVTILGQITAALKVMPCDLLRPGQGGAAPGAESQDLES